MRGGRNMIKIRLRTKIEAIVVIFFLLCLAAVSVTSITRTITNTSDDIYTYIRNSNGNYWEVSVPNLQTALNDVSNVPYWGYGAVWLPAGCTLTFGSGDKIDMPQGVKLEGNGARFEVTSGAASNPYVISMNRRTYLRDINIDANENFEGACVFIDGNKHINKEHECIIENVYCVSDDHIGSSTGFYLEADSDGEYCNFAIIQDCRTYGFTYGYRINVQGGSASSSWSYINSNSFINCISIDDTYGIYLDRNTGEPNKNACSVDGNAFINFHMQADADGNTIDGVHVVGRSNRFFGCVFWDWFYASGNIANIDSDAEFTYIEYNGHSDNSKILDSGVESTIFNIGHGILDLGAKYIQSDVYHQSIEPDIPNDSFAFWIDSDDSKFYLILDHSGIQKKEELT